MRHRRLVPLALAAGLALGGCASIPTSGPVATGEAQVASTGSAVALPEGPQAGASARGIVEGFLLAASAGLTGDFQVAREFLSRSSAQSWDPMAGTTVTGSTTLDQTSDAQITATLDVVGKVDAGGRYVEASQSHESVSFDLVKVGGEWRISDPPAGLIVSDRVFAQQYRAAPLYFLTTDDSQLVPDVRYFPTRNVATSVVRALIAGPSPWLRDAVATAVPDGVELKPEAVTVDGQGTAQVVLQPASVVAQAAQRGLMLAQITQSLDLPGISAVQVRAGVNGALLDNATTFADPPVTTPVMIAGDALVGLSGSATTPVPGVGSLAGLGARGLAVNDDGTVRVALGIGGLLRLPSTGQAARLVLAGSDLVEPSVDRFGWVWTAHEQTGAGLLAVGAKDQQVPVTGDWLGGLAVTALRVSRDGSRVAIVTAGPGGSSVEVAGVARDKAGAPTSVGSSVQVGTGTTPAAQVVWLDDQTLVVIGHVAAAAVITVLPVGGPSEVLPAVSDAVRVAADRGDRSLLVVTSSGALNRYTGRTWTQVGGVGGVQDLTYPG